jgi:hypothetical protein
MSSLSELQNILLILVLAIAVTRMQEDASFVSIAKNYSFVVGSKHSVVLKIYHTPISCAALSLCHADEACLGVKQGSF